MSEILEKVHVNTFYTILLLTGVVYIITFPQGWLISDEYTYVNGAIAITEGLNYLGYDDPVTGEFYYYKNSNYTLGNAFWIAFWTKLVGIKKAYVGSLFILLGSMFLLFQTLRREKYFLPAIGLTLLYPATLVFSHSLMSGVPSFGLVCVFIFLLFAKEDNGKKWFWLTFIAAFSFWFRETNVLLLGGICLIHFLMDRRWLGYYVAGGCIGFLPRLLSAWWAYDDPFYYVLGASFSFDNLVNNLWLYAFLLLILMPFGGVLLAIYKGKYRYPIVISCFAFIGLYMFYGYNAIAYSGYMTGTMVMSRFLLPILPLYILAVGWQFKEIKPPYWLLYCYYLFVLIVCIGSQFYIDSESSVHASVSSKIYKDYNSELVLYDLSGVTNIIRYVNPYHGSFKHEADISRLIEEDYMKKAFLISPEITTYHTLNIANLDKQAKTNKVISYLDQGLKNYSLVNSDTLRINESLRLVRMKIENK